MKIKFYIPEKIQGHEVGNALVLGAERSHLCEGNEVLEIEGGRGVQVVLLLTPDGADTAQSYVAYEWGRNQWQQVELPIFTFDKIALGEMVKIEEKEKQTYPDLNPAL